MNDTDVTTDATKYHNTIEPRDDYPSHLRPLPEGYVYVGTGADIPNIRGVALYYRWDSDGREFSAYYGSVGIFHYALPEGSLLMKRDEPGGAAPPPPKTFRPYIGEAEPTIKPLEVELIEEGGDVVLTVGGYRALRVTERGTLYLIRGMEDNPDGIPTTEEGTFVAEGDLFVTE